MASYKNFSKKRRAEADWEYNNTDSPLSYDPINQERIEYEEWTKFLSYYRYYLDKFAESCDTATSHLQAAALPRQKTQVLLPLTNIKDNEIYAPNFKNGETVALVK